MLYAVPERAGPGVYIGVHFADVKCDEPLATLLILYGSSMVLSLFGFMYLQQFRKMEGEGTLGGSATASSCMQCDQAMQRPMRHGGLRAGQRLGVSAATRVRPPLGPLRCAPLLCA